MCGLVQKAKEGHSHINIQISEFEGTYLTLLEKEMATHSSILAWRIPCTEEPHVHEPMGSQIVRPDGVVFTLSYIKST